MPATSPIEADLIEVFSSIQGEGVLIGCRQVFARFADCNLSCAYCDTPFHGEAAYRFETAPGSGESLQLKNPADLLALGAVLEQWRSMHPGLHHSLCLTGGEPLLHAEALKRWLPVISATWPVYLETNGTLPLELGKVLRWITWISMDIKTEETTGQATRWEAHAQFMETAENRLCQVKLVVGAKTDPETVRRAAGLVKRHAPGAPLILQPCMSKGRLTVTGPVLLQLQAAAADLLPDTRLIPQVHPFLGLA